MLFAEAQGLQTLDWILIALYGVFVIGIGAYESLKQSTAEEYFVGKRNMNPVLIGVSLFATLLSTISYLSMPGEAFGKGPMYLTSWLALPFVYVVVAYVLLPVYMKQRVTSAYELLEVKLGLSIRLLGAVMFILMRLVWMTLLVYVAARAVQGMIGVDEGWIPLIVAVIGFVAVTYTSLGGLRAVVITDLLQTILLFGGALLVIAIVTIDFGGFGWFPIEWQENWDVQPFFSFDPSVRVTAVGSFLAFFIWMTCTSGADQVSVQRFMATSNAEAARRALAAQIVVTAVVVVTLTIVGFALLGYFQAHPEFLEQAKLNVKTDADDMFPYFIGHHLPVGIAGLVVAAMFAAAMSSVDSGINSITAVVQTDFIDRLIRPKETQGQRLHGAQFLALGIGIVIILGSAYVGKIPGNITAVTNKSVNLLVTPLFGLFFFALFVPFARPAGVWAGAVCGTIVALLVAFSGPIVTYLALYQNVDPATFGVELMTKIDSDTGVQIQIAPDPISFQWIPVIALAVNLLIGTTISGLLSLFGRQIKTDNQMGEQRQP